MTAYLATRFFCSQIILIFLFPGFRNRFGRLPLRCLLIDRSLLSGGHSLIFFPVEEQEEGLCHGEQHAEDQIQHRISGVQRLVYIIQCHEVDHRVGKGDARQRQTDTGDTDHRAHDTVQDHGFIVKASKQNAAGNIMWFLIAFLGQAMPRTVIAIVKNSFAIFSQSSHLRLARFSPFTTY